MNRIPVGALLVERSKSAYDEVVAEYVFRFSRGKLDLGGRKRRRSYCTFSSRWSRFVFSLGVMACCDFEEERVVL